MDTMPDLERPLALEEIMLLKARRDRALDTRDWDACLALHAPDHCSDNDGHDRWNTAAETIENIRTALPAGTKSVHHAHTPDITVESPTRARGIWGMENAISWMQGDQEHWQKGFGFRHEIYEKRDGRWLFTFRQIRRMHRRTPPGAVRGLVASGAPAAETP